jgi:hypothetical protein
MKDKTLPVTGGCLCGAVRYQSTEPPDEVAYCHCRRCQKGTGSPYFLGASFPKESFQFTKGEPKYYKSSAWAERGFCAACGTPLVYRYEIHDPYLCIGTLDHPEEWPPNASHSGMESKIPWDTCWNTEDDQEFIEAMAVQEQPHD